MVLVAGLASRAHSLVVLLLLRGGGRISGRYLRCVCGLLVGDWRLYTSFLLLHGLGKRRSLLVQLLLRLLLLVILTELMLLELVHEVLLVGGLHRTRRRIEHHGFLQLLGFLAARQHFDVVAVATLA